MKKFKVRIEGMRPLLQHRFDDSDTAAKSTKRAGPRDFSEEWKKGLYQMENGTIYQPAEHIEKSIERAATNFQIRGRGQKTYKELCTSSVCIEPIFIPHKKQKFEIDRRSVRVQKSRIMRERPRFDEWALDFEIVVTEDQLPGPVLKEILDHAGRHIGIGDYRPKFGLFYVTEWKEIK